MDEKDGRPRLVTVLTGAGLSTDSAIADELVREPIGTALPRLVARLGASVSG